MSVLSRGRLSLLSFLLLMTSLLATAPGAGAAASKVVQVAGLDFRVPADWPVFWLSAHPGVCVRFNRHAVYVGRPNPAAVCPVGASGRTEAILVTPRSAGVTGLSGSGVTSVVEHGLRITATWRRDPGVIRTALSRRHLVPVPAPPAMPVPARARTAAPPSGRGPLTRRTVTAGAPVTPGSFFTGEGFDACSTPSTATMARWAATSPYGAIGVYVGGENVACSQGNLTASWMSAESAAGWHVVPIYVGLQAPGNSCGCAPISPNQAASEGAADAATAVQDAAGVGIGAGNPIYFDMEGYSRTAANSTTVLTFLQAWTEVLHGDGYLSGVYSSDDSGIVDLVARHGSGYVEPDELWFAAWNGQSNTQDANVPGVDWAAHQRLHQFQGGVDETYGGVTINVDNDELDAATAAYGSSSGPVPLTGPAPTPATTPAPAPAPAPAPVAVPAASAPPTLTGTPVAGQTLTEAHGDWSNTPASFSLQWQRCAPIGGGCTVIPGAASSTYTLTGADTGEQVEVVEVAANAAGSGTPAASAPTPTVATRPSGFWSFTAAGTAVSSQYELNWGSAAPNGRNNFVGMAATRGRGGYWLVTRYATVAAFGDAPTLAGIRVAHPVTGIVRSARAGYYLFTAQGNVYASQGASFLGSLASRHLSNVSGMATLPNAAGYWLVARSGTVWAFGAAPLRRPIRPAHAVIGIVAAPNHGYWIYTAAGNVYNSVGAGFYGSPARTPGANIVSMLATPDGRGYWLLSQSGQIFAYGDAPSMPNLSTAGGPLLGLAG